MREIKFRAWQNDKAVKRMIYPKDLVEYATLTFDGYPDNTMHSGFFCGYRGYVPPSNYILMQYTGLKDKNGNEIYEGDIVEGKNLDYFMTPGLQRVAVEYIDGGFYPFADNNDYAPYPRPEEVEIISNIYENRAIRQLR